MFTRKVWRGGRRRSGRAASARRLSPQGRAGCSASPGRSRSGRGPGAAARARALPSPPSPVLPGRGFWAPRRKAHAPLPRPRCCPGAPLEPCARRLVPGGRRVQNVSPAPGFAGALCRARERTPAGKEAPRVRAEGPKTSPNLPSPPGLGRRQQQRPRLRAPLWPRC